MDRSDIAAILGIAPERVRIIPTAVGGGLGSKLDLSVQPFLAVAAWHLGKSVRMVYSRTESILSPRRDIRRACGFGADAPATANSLRSILSLISIPAHIPRGDQR